MEYLIVTVGMVSALWILLTPLGFLRVAFGIARNLSGVSDRELTSGAVPWAVPLVKMALGGESASSLTSHERFHANVLIWFVRAVALGGLLLASAPLW